MGFISLSKARIELRFDARSVVPDGVTRYQAARAKPRQIQPGRKRKIFRLYTPNGGCGRPLNVSLMKDCYVFDEDLMSVSCARGR